MSALFVIRPQPGCAATLAAGRDMGLDIVGEPLFAIRPRAWQAPDPANVDALLVGSGNALRHGGGQLDLFTARPVHAVGATTAELARRRGFAIGLTGQGGLQQVLDALPPARVRLLRLAGADHVALQVPSHVTVETRIVYESAALPMPAALAGRLAGGGTVLLHSAVAARHFARECDRLGLARAGIALATLGPRISAAAGEGWRSLRAASDPTDSALLALARDMCH